MLKLNLKEDCLLKDEVLAVWERLKNRADSFAPESNLILHCTKDDIALELVESSITPELFRISWSDNHRLLWRLSHSGKKSEALCRAVMGKLDKPVVFDATAGLGRESMILQSAGCSVTMFERNEVTYLLLLSALFRAENDKELLSVLKNSLPKMTGYGSLSDQIADKRVQTRPDVVYYDPMFPERSKSALVKKEMRVFHALCGFDEDTLEYADFLTSVPKHHLVIKRPAKAPPLELKIRRSSFVDGKACRFDCYYTGSADS